MRIATWNINGVKARMGDMLKWLEQVSPDVVCLQEIKSVDDEFPRMEIEALGYNVETFGQKSWNGVAILSKNRFDEVTRGQGKVIPTSKAQLIQSAEPATVRELLVRSGQRVRRGDFLSSVAEAAYGDASQWRAIASANEIDDPRRIEPGRVLRVPRLKV